MKDRNKGHNFFHYLITVFVFLVKGILGEFVWFFVAASGYLIYKTRVTPYDMIIGVPLMLIGIGLIVNFVWSELLAVFSWKYNKEVCVICMQDEDMNE